MQDQSSPEMSVVIVTDRYQTIHQTLSHLKTQTVKARLEIVIVAPSAEQLALDEVELKDFLQVRVVAIGVLQSLSWARAAGVRQASAPVVGFVESHSYPAPGWAEGLIEAHRQPWAAVGPAVNNANPKTGISWANFLLDYGRWLEPATAGEIDDLPGHNSSYKRQVLLDYGSELEAMLEAESMLHWDLRAKGYRLYLEPKAKIVHLNISRLSSWIPERFHAGRRFAAARARLWSPLRRLLYTGGAPLIPLVRLPRILEDIRRSARWRDVLPKVLPALLVSLSVSAVGEMIGYAFGSGDSMEKLARLELNKIPHLAKRDRPVAAF
jgi:glycosyltransferase involved in cell wall biosynthesis